MTVSILAELTDYGATNVQKLIKSSHGANLFVNTSGKCAIITARKRSLGQGNIFIGVCQEFCSQCVGGIPACLAGGILACLAAGLLGALLLGGLVLGGVWSQEGCLVPEGCLLGPGCGLLLWPSVVVFCYALLLWPSDLVAFWLKVAFWYGLWGPEGHNRRSPHQKATTLEGHNRRPPHQKATWGAWWRPCSPPPPPKRLLLWAVCILLECILVCIVFSPILNLRIVKKISSVSTMKFNWNSLAYSCIFWASHTDCMAFQNSKMRFKCAQPISGQADLQLYECMFVSTHLLQNPARHKINLYLYLWYNVTKHTSIRHNMHVT